jgi:hypothetical protein
VKLQTSATVSSNVEHSSKHFDASIQAGGPMPVVGAAVSGSIGGMVGDAPVPSPRLTVDHVIVPHEIRPAAEGGPGQVGVFATDPIAAGTTSIVFGGFVTPGEVFRQLPALRQQHSFQIGDDLFLACDEQLNDGDLVNHSCEPTLGFAGEITLVALRDIEAGEQLTFDCATCDSQPYDEFECECGSSACRIKVTGEDWMRPDLQVRYRGNFSPYLQRRIDTLPR